MRHLLPVIAIILTSILSGWVHVEYHSIKFDRPKAAAGTLLILVGCYLYLFSHNYI